MAYEPYIGGELPNLVNVTKRLDPDGSIAKIAELLQQFNPIIEDVPLVEGNLPTGHRTTVRADLPVPTWRMLNYGVRPTKSITAQVDDTIGMLEDYGEVDKDLAMLNGNTAEFRMSEDTPHLESMSNTMAETIFGEYRPGSRVNLEVDVIARYLERLVLGDAAADPKATGGLSLATLAENGFLRG